SERNQPQKLSGKINDLKRKINEIAVNYVTLVGKLIQGRDNYKKRNIWPDQKKDQRCYRCGELGHISRFCRSEKFKHSVENQNDTKRPDKRPKIVNYCEVNEEIFIISNELVPQKIIKHPNKPDWNTRLREKKLPNTQQEKEDQEIENPIVTTQRTTAARCNVRIYDNPVIAVLDSGAVVSIMSSKLQYKLELEINDKAITMVIMATGAHAKTLGREYDSDEGDTFDEFDYEEDNLEEIDEYFMDEWSEVDNQVLAQGIESEENPALFLINIKEPPVKEKEEKSIVERIQEFINVNLMTPEQQRQAKEFLIKEKTLFAKNIDELGKTSVIMHTINKGEAIAMKQRPYRISHDENKAAAVIRVEKAQQKAKKRYTQQALKIEDLKRGELILVFKASQENSKSHKLSP
ncbi:14149_t:CDS:2, partial [Cetraspora pellucida]